MGASRVGASGGLCPCTSQAPSSARPGGPRSLHSGPHEARPRMGCSTDTWIPQNAFGKDLFLKKKPAPPTSGGDSTFCSPHSGLHICCLSSVCLSAPSYPGGNSLGERGRKEKERGREGKRNWKRRREKLAPGPAAGLSAGHPPSLPGRRLPDGPEGTTAKTRGSSPSPGQGTHRARAQAVGPSSVRLGRCARKPRQVASSGPSWQRGRALP